MQVAILCNHQKAVGKGHDGAMEKLQEKLKDLRKQLKELKAAKACVPLLSFALCSPHGEHSAQHRALVAER